MRTRTMVLVIAGTVLAGAAAMAIAGPGPGDGRGHGGPGAGMRGPMGPLGMALQRLDLTAEQEQRIEAILEAARPATEALRKQLRDGREAFVAAHPPTQFDEAAVRAHATEQAKIRVELAVAMAKVRAEVLGVLTPEQLAQLETMRAEREGRHQDRFGGPGDCFGGPDD